MYIQNDVAISRINFFCADMLPSDIQVSSFVPLLQIVYLGFLNQYSQRKQLFQLFVLFLSDLVLNITFISEKYIEVFLLFYFYALEEF